MPQLSLKILLIFFWFNISSAENSKISYRLPNTTVPVLYKVHIVTNIHKQHFDFSGNVTIDVLLKVDTDRIVLQARDLNDFIITVTNLETEYKLPDITYQYDNLTNFLTIFANDNFDHIFEAGHRYRLEILYNGIIRSQTFGIYWSAYNNSDGNIIYLAATQFEPTSARSAFPCFDEPAFKAKFVVRLTHGNNYTALSNMPSDGIPIECSNNMTITTFQETPIMSTYLLAFIVSNYEHITEVFNGIRQSVYTPPSLSDIGKKNLKNAIRTLSTLEDYLGIRYPLPKLDHIALQKSYGAAMENWGLITYRMDTFLQTSETDKNKILMNIITQNHEISHQWFGNLVSPIWWSYAWLNEGFATYFGYLVTDLIYPDFNAMELFINIVANMAYSWPANRPLTFYVERETDISSVFDVVSYQKAACIIKMFHHAVNHKTFIRGVSSFLMEFQYSAADENDLFKSIQSVVSDNENNIQEIIGNNSVVEIMASWTHNSGIPIITMLRNYEENTITIRQRSTLRTSDELWWIPINFASSSKPDFETTRADFIIPPMREITIHPDKHNISLSADDWLIVNKQQTGFYHVVYDEINFQAITNALHSNYKDIHYLNRALLFRDILSVLEKNEIDSIESVLELLKYLRNEDELLPWNSATDMISVLGTNLYGTSSHAPFQEFIRSLIFPIFRRFHRMSKSNLTASGRNIRNKVIAAACGVDLDECLEFVKYTTQNYVFNNEEVDDNFIHSTTLCEGIKYLSTEEFQLILEKLTTVKESNAFYDAIVYALRCTRNPDNVIRFLNVLLGNSSTHLLMTDIESMEYIFYMYTSNAYARSFVFEFIQNNYKNFWQLKIFGELLSRISAYVAEQDTQKFLDLLDLIKAEEELSRNGKTESHIEIDIKKIGIRARKKETFNRSFGERIFKWLTNHQRVIKASIGITSGANDERGSSLSVARYILAAQLLRKFVK